LHDVVAGDEGWVRRGKEARTKAVRQGFTGGQIDLRGGVGAQRGTEVERNMEREDEWRTMWVLRGLVDGRVVEEWVPIRERLGDGGEMEVDCDGADMEVREEKEGDLDGDRNVTMVDEDEEDEDGGLLKWARALDNGQKLQPPWVVTVPEVDHRDCDLLSQSPLSSTLELCDNKATQQQSLTAPSPLPPGPGPGQARTESSMPLPARQTFSQRMRYDIIRHAPITRTQICNLSSDSPSIHFAAAEVLCKDLNDQRRAEERERRKYRYDGGIMRQVVQRRQQKVAVMAESVVVNDPIPDAYADGGHRRLRWLDGAGREIETDGLIGEYDEAFKKWAKIVKREGAQTEGVVNVGSVKWCEERWDAPRDDTAPGELPVLLGQKHWNKLKIVGVGGDHWIWIVQSGRENEDEVVLEKISVEEWENLHESSSADGPELTRRPRGKKRACSDDEQDTRKRTKLVCLANISPVKSNQEPQPKKVFGFRCKKYPVTHSVTKKQVETAAKIDL
jgi:hypothetical protein